MKTKLYKLLLFSGILFGLGNCASPDDAANVDDFHLPYYAEENFIPVWIEKEEDLSVIKHRIKPFDFINQYGEFITDKQINNKVHIANFFFSTCPGICPMMINQLKEVQSAFKNNDNVVLLSYSVNPEEDTPEILKDYADQHSIIKEKWHLLTGRKAELYKHARASYFADKDTGIRIEDDFLHTENTFLVDQKGYIRGIYNGTQHQDIERLIEDVKRLLTDEKIKS